MSFLEHERVRELLARAGLDDASPRAVRRIAVTGVLVCAIGLWRFWPSAPAPEVAYDEAEQSPGSAVAASATAGMPSELVVHVAGAVAHPGVYRLPPGSRVADAVAAAGGTLGNAAPDAVNLARVLSDGEQVRLPTAEEVAAGSTAQTPGTGGSPTAASSGVVDLNSATAAELESLPGIGAATAQKIVDDREANGPFATPEDLMRVPGIGAKKFEALKDMVSAG